MRKYLLLLQILLVSASVYSQVIPDQSMLKAHAPATFKANFITTRGTFTILVTRKFSPAGADRLYQLLATGFYNQNALFRVQKGYVVQFGICNDSAVNYFWDKRPIQDEPVTTGNLKGTIAYARDGLNSRSSQLFVNLKDNFKLDTINFNGLHGFPPVGEVIAGFDVIESLYGGYGFEPANHQDSVMKQGNRYLKMKFPELDYIIETVIIDK